MRVLYLSYDGALDPLGASQVLPYLETLSRRGYVYDLISFEKDRRWRDLEGRSRTERRLRGAGIGWHPLRYHRRPPVVSTAYDLVAGLRLARRLASAHPTYDLVHVRSYPCAVIARRLRRELGLPYVFDIRGFYAEERVDGGLWRSGGPLFRVTKRLEGGLLRDASAVVTLTRASVASLTRLMDAASATAPVHVITTAVDLARFQVAAVPDVPHLMYLGSIGTWYLLPEMAALVAIFLERVPDGRVTFLANGEHERIWRALAEHAVAPERVDVRSVGHEDVPAELGSALATFALIRPSPSKVASAPTKFGESLAVGAPLLVNPGIGDAAELVCREHVGVVLDPYRPDDYASTIDALLSLARQPGIRERCRDVATREFSLERAADRYQAAYEDVVAAAKAGRA